MDQKMELYRVDWVIPVSDGENERISVSDRVDQLKADLDRLDWRSWVSDSADGQNPNSNRLDWKIGIQTVWTKESENRLQALWPEKSDSRLAGPKKLVSTVWMDETWSQTAVWTKKNSFSPDRTN